MDTLLDLLDLDALESAATSTVTFGPRLSRPIYVDGYDTSSMDPSQHHILFRWVNDTESSVAPMKMFLSADDPSAGNADPTKRRPSIQDFESRELAHAIDTNNMPVILALPQETNAKCFTRLGGIILADRLREVDGGWEARWLVPIRQSHDDSKHNAFLGWTNIHKRPSGRGYDVECLLEPNATLVTTFGDLVNAMRAAFADATFGRPGVYLRLFQVADDGARTFKFIVGATKDSTGRIDRRDKKLATNEWTLRTIDEAIADFLGTDAGKLLNKSSWGGKVAIEVIPLMTLQFGEKSIRSMTPDVPYTITKTAAGEPAQGGPSALHGYSNSTVRLTAVFEQGASQPKYYIVSRAQPMTGELFSLRDLPTEHYNPGAAATFPVYPKLDKPAYDANSALEGEFKV
ncbi:hypothetical protein [Azospirillum canadense]|uniref:hypothetical protein n=1 Tax=Azospirillum canadense TaxID=403962 RepID=UPI002227B262|nr:hypothetical protein [Azospirillum canadense]MCW2240385.1 hypothetical protein [Azospirillum canadense]